MTFAIIKTGGKQYKVTEGDILNIEKTASKDGEINFDQVLLYVNDTKTSVGKPTINGALVTAQVIKEDKAKKKIVFRYKNKTRHRKKKGHRQPYTQVKIIKISLD